MPAILPSITSPAPTPLSPAPYPKFSRKVRKNILTNSGRTQIDQGPPEIFQTGTPASPLPLPPHHVRKANLIPDGSRTENSDTGFLPDGRGPGVGRLRLLRYLSGRGDECPVHMRNGGVRR